MPIVERARGVRVDLPAGYRIAEQSTSATRTVAEPGDATLRPTYAAEHGALLAALANQRLELVDTLPIEPVAPPPGVAPRRSPSSVSRRTVGVAVRIASSENVAALIERGGVFSWVMPDRVERAPRTNVIRRRGAAAMAGIPESAGAGLAHFTIEIRAEPARAKARQQRGIISDVVVRSVTVFVLKFVAHAMVGNVMSLLERHVDTGLVVVARPDPSTWRRADDLAAAKLPKSRPARVLLLVHGTFSNTVGGFAALGVHPWGKAFLQSAIDTYDLVLGYDHRTLAVDPLENASDLLARLRAALGQQPPTLDIVSHSRGGLVTRSLIELVAPYEDWRPVVEHAVFVAGTNRGTLLAEPRNWNALLDVYTNSAMAATRALNLLPQTALFGTILGGAIQGVGALVKALVTAGISEGAAPGLAAMEPDGPFVTKINQTQPGQPDREHSNYYAVSSDFSAAAPGEDPIEMPPRLMAVLEDRLMDALMKESNDLIVNVSSMAAIDETTGGFIDDELAFGRNRTVYHSNYFGRPEVAAALARWLGLTQPMAATSRRGARRCGSPNPPYVVGSGALVGAPIPAAAETDVLVASSSASVDFTANAIADTEPAYIVVRRPTSGGRRLYAFSQNELRGMLADSSGSEPIGAALGLGATEGSAIRSVSSLAFPVGRVGASRSVLTDGDLVVGVLPEAGSLPTSAELLMTPSSLAAPWSSLPLRRRGAKPLHRGARGKAPKGEVRAHVPQVPGARERFVAAAAPRSSRTITSSRHAPAGPEASPTVITHMFAQMPSELVLGAVTKIQVDLSRERLRRRSTRTASGGDVGVAEDRPIILKAIPRANVAMVGRAQVEIPVPTADRPAQVFFEVKAIHASEGEVWVVVRQDQLPLLTLVLKPKIVRRAGHRRAARQLRVDAAVADPTPMPSIPTLRIIEESDGTSIFYRYDLDVPELDILQEYRSSAITGDRDAYVQQLYTRIEQDWGASKSDVEAFQASLRAFGGELLDQLMPPELRSVLWRHREHIKNIMVLSDEPFVPWELVHLKAPGAKTLPKQTYFLGQMGLVRWLYGTRPPLTLRIRKGQARFVIPDYPAPEWALPETANERTYLESTFGATAIEPHLNPVRRAISMPGSFDLLHFAGHGMARGGSASDAAILLEGRMEPGDGGEPTYAKEELDVAVVSQFADLVAGGHRPIVVFNACQVGRLGRQLTTTGGFARSFLGAGAGAFISSLWSVTDQPAREFTEQFYDSLRSGAPVSQAVIAARQAARAAGDATWLAYVVYASPAARLDAR
jgi:hypothetical protein